ncbi:IclR family transcriptional regulator [Alkalihalobacillus sp. 1P02AB]|uniref:IclR family transcriptional regulator n=1 Tax=Alkalihalobacillus sp. 1P02AB TaxID=3132260 RepID=UPI0039A4DCBA
MSAERTLEILELFTINQRELSVPQMAELLDKPTSSVYRHLRVLKEKGFVTEQSNGFYRLGYRFLELATIVKSYSSISEISLPYMRELTRETGETSILTVRSDLNVVSLEVVSSHEPVNVSSEQGKIIPLYGGASSKPLLAYADESVLDELFDKDIVQKHTDKTITNKGELKRELADIRENGYSTSDEELDIGVYAIGVPIQDANNYTVATLSIAGPRERMLQKNQTELINKLLDSVKQIQKYL